MNDLYRFVEPSVIATRLFPISVCFTMKKSSHVNTSIIFFVTKLCVCFVEQTLSDLTLSMSTTYLAAEEALRLKLWSVKKKSGGTSKLVSVSILNMNFSSIRHLVNILFTLYGERSNDEFRSNYTGSRMVALWDCSCWLF